MVERQDGVPADELFWVHGSCWSGSARPAQGGLDVPPEFLAIDVGFGGDREDDEPVPDQGVERPPPAPPTARAQFP